MFIKDRAPLFAGAFLAFFFALQGWLIHGAETAMKDYSENYSEPLVAASSHSLLYPETHPEAAIDGDASTFWADTGRPGPAPGKALLPYEGLYLVFAAGLTHRPGRFPAPLPLKGLALTIGAPGKDFAEYSRPHHIRLSYYEQQLYQINHDYRFPDQPMHVASKDYVLADKQSEQVLMLDFLPAPPSSKGFPDQIKARWFRLEILDTYPGRSRSATAVTEIRLLHAEGHDGPLESHP